MLDAMSADSTIVSAAGISSSGETFAVTRNWFGDGGLSTRAASTPMIVGAFTSDAVWAALAIVMVGARERPTAEPGISAVGTKFVASVPALLSAAFSSAANSPAVAGRSPRSLPSLARLPR